MKCLIVVAFSAIPVAGLAGGSNYGIVPGVLPNLAGKVSEVLVAEGQAVRKGDSLMRLDGSLLNAQREVALRGLESARSAHQTAQSALSLAQAQYDAAVIAARKIATMHHVPLLIGGPETYIGDPLLAWADHLCIGEGYRLLSTLAQRGISAIADAPNVLSRGSSTTISPDYTIPWKEIPAIQTAPRAYYYLHGRGCHRKCKFCFTSWT